jgi:hypothetical protein
MIFKQISELLSGQKTQTRRVAKGNERLDMLFDGTITKVLAETKKGKLRKKWAVGQDYAITPKMYQPALKTHRMKIVGIRQEYLHDITEADARAEGVPDIQEYKRLWGTINTKKGVRWEDNPMVWVIDFEVFEVA